MVEQGLMDRLIEALEAGDWTIAAGAILLVLAVVVRRVTRDRLSESAASWMSASCALAAGVAAPLLAGGVWWHALLIGIFVVPSSEGFWVKIGSRIPKDGPPAALTMAAILLIAMSLPTAMGCGARQAQVGTRTALTSVAESLESADHIAAMSARERSSEVLESIRSECGDPCPDALERYQAAMDQWSDAARALRTAREALVSADEIVEVWIATGSLPESWGRVCSSAAEALRALLAAVETATGEVPESVQAAPGIVEGACRLAEPWIGGTR